MGIKFTMAISLIAQPYLAKKEKKKKKQVQQNVSYMLIKTTAKHFGNTNFVSSSRHLSREKQLDKESTLYVVTTNKILQLQMQNLESTF